MYFWATEKLNLIGRTSFVLLPDKVCALFPKSHYKRFLGLAGLLCIITMIFLLKKTQKRRK